MSRIKAFGYALRGILFAFNSEIHLKIHVLATVLVVVLGLIVGVSFVEWAVLLLCIGGVIGLEMMNSALEKLADRLHPQRDDSIRYVKDVAAGAVLVFSLISLVIGGIIFIPHFI